MKCLDSLQHPKVVFTLLDFFLDEINLCVSTKFDVEEKTSTIYIPFDAPLKAIYSFIESLDLRTLAENNIHSRPHLKQVQQCVDYLKKEYKVKEVILSPHFFNNSSKLQHLDALNRVRECLDAFESIDFSSTVFYLMDPQQPYKFEAEGQEEGEGEINPYFATIRQNKEKKTKHLFLPASFTMEKLVKYLELWGEKEELQREIEVLQEKAEYGDEHLKFDPADLSREQLLLSISAKSP